MSQYRPYKFLVIPVIQEVDDDGVVISEASPEQPVPVFGIDGLHRFADGFEADLIAKTPQNGSGIITPSREIIRP